LTERLVSPVTGQSLLETSIPGKHPSGSRSYAKQDQGCSAAESENETRSGVPESRGRRAANHRRNASFTRLDQYIDAERVPLPIYRFSKIHSMLSLWGVEVEARLGGHIERL
jgi:hypothetical protein